MKKNNLYTKSESRAMKKLIIAALLGCLPPKKNYQLVSEWAEEKRVLPQGLTSRPGPFRFTESEPMREIVNNLSESSDIREVALMKGAQLAGTVAVMENFIGYIIDVAPGPTMAITGDKQMSDIWMEKRVDPLIQSAGISHKIFAQVQKSHGKKTGDTKDSKEFPGGFLLAYGPNSGSKLRSNAIQYLLLDEEDAYPQEVGDEGDPIALAIRRTDTYETSRKILHISTPLSKGTSRIERAFFDGDQRFYFVPCKHCGKMQKLEFKNLSWEKDTDGNLIWESVKYTCNTCGGHWKNSDKAFFLRSKESGGIAEWIATAKPKKRFYRSYHLSSLYSSIGARSWESIIEEFINIKDDRGRLKTFVNTVLGETFEERGDAPRWERVMLKRGRYESGTLPEGSGVLILTMGADVQKDRIEYEIVGWGDRKRSHSIKYGVIFGDTKNINDPCWTELSRVMESEHAGHQIKMSLIDCGYNTTTVYQFCEQYSSGVYAVMGDPVNSTSKSIFTIRDVAGYSTKRVNIQTGMLKSEIYGYLYKDKTGAEDEQSGICAFPDDYGQEYFEQITAESFVLTKLKNGGKKWEWKKSRDRNEALDCRIYSMAALYVLASMVQDEISPDNSISWDLFWLMLKNAT